MHISLAVVASEPLLNFMAPGVSPLHSGRLNGLRRLC